MGDASQEIITEPAVRVDSTATRVDSTATADARATALPSVVSKAAGAGFAPDQLEGVYLRRTVSTGYGGMVIF